MNIVFNSISGSEITLGSTLIMLLSAMAMGFAVSLVYMRTHREDGYMPSLIATLVLLPAISSTIILLVGNNTAQALSLAGAAALIRFRATLGDPKDLAYLFFTLSIVLACGSGYIGYAAVFTVLVCAVMLVLELTGFGKNDKNAVKLKFLIPEDLDYPGAFDDVFAKYAEKWILKKVKTTEYGTLFELHYLVMPKKDINTKELIDELRTRNGNLNVTLMLNPNEDREYIPI